MEFVFTSGAKTPIFRLRDPMGVMGLSKFNYCHWCAKSLKHFVFHVSYIKLGVPKRDPVSTTVLALSGECLLRTSLGDTEV